MNEWMTRELRAAGYFPGLEYPSSHPKSVPDPQQPLPLTLSIKQRRERWGCRTPIHGKAKVCVRIKQNTYGTKKDGQMNVQQTAMATRALQMVSFRDEPGDKSMCLCEWGVQLCWAGNWEAWVLGESLTGWLT